MAYTTCPHSNLALNLLVSLLMLFLPISVDAQIRNSTDGLTPPGMAPGAPAGSYPLSEFENINLYNGQMSFLLPVAQNGRGGANISLPIRITPPPWSVRHELKDYPNPYPIGQAYQHVYSADLTWWNETVSRAILPGGRMIGRYVTEDPQDCYGDGTLYYMRTNMRFTFTAPDGTEYNLIDKEQGGNPRLGTCGSFGNNSRGSVFVTQDGTSATFYSQLDGAPYAYADIVDAFSLTYYNISTTFHPSGYLILKDGTRYDISGGNVTRMRDRNGNEVRYDAIVTSAGIVGWTITDSLNRQIIINYDVNDGPPYGVVDRITIKGFGGADRYIRIKQLIGGPLRTTQPTDPTTGWTVQQLFPELDNTYSYVGGLRVSTIWMPDGRTYNFKYNVYWELARVELPAGGAIEYDYSGGYPGDTSSGVIGYYTVPRGPVPAGSEAPRISIYRRLVERRVYSGLSISTLIGKTTYSKPEIIVTPGGDHSSNLLVEQWDPNSGACLARSRHYFNYSAFYSLLKLWDAGAEDILEGKEIKTEVLDTSPSMAVLRKVENVWGRNTFVANNGFPIWINPHVVETKTTLFDANLVSKQTFGYDQYNNQTDVYEYDFGTGAPGSLIRHTNTSYLTTNGNQGNVNYATDVNIHIRNLPVQKIVYDASGNLRSHTDFIYDYYGAYTLVDRPGIVQHDGGFYAGYGIRGNLTGVILRNPGGSPSEIHLHNQYDIAGNLVKAVDGRGIATDFDYSDRFGAPGNDARSNAGPPELAGGFSYAFPTKVTNALLHTAYTQYDYYLGRVVTTEDANGVVSSVEYNDALDRPTQSIQARYNVGGWFPIENRQTTITYDDANRVITTTGDRDAFGDNLLKSKIVYDGLGRTVEARTYAPGPAGCSSPCYSLVKTTFDAMGRTYQVSNPYWNHESPIWTTTQYDALSRVTSVTTPDGATVSSAYNGAQVTVTDQAGKKRRSETDALGRLIKVTEAPGVLGYETIYLYDALGNLRKVTQGAQTRWFAYDSLSRLIRAKNPEQEVNANPNMSYTDPVTTHNGWSMAYTYDANGNLFSKTDARNITTTYGYDALNRNESVDYSDTTPDIKRIYDNTYPNSNGIGRFWYSYVGGDDTTGQEVEHTAIDNYDALGRPRDKRQHFKKNGVWSAAYYSVNQTYDLAGNVRTLTYPSGRTINYSYDQAGRLSSFSGNLGGSPATYADTIGYNAAGQMSKERFVTNTPLYHNSHYNNRMQLVDIRVGDIATDEWNWSRGLIIFFYGTTAVNTGDIFANDTDNNGNLRRQATGIPLASGGYVIPQQDDYTYDALNRVSSFTEAQRDSSGQWTQNVASQNFSYDPYGNRQITSATGGVSDYNPGYNLATNRINGLGYDAAGNIMSDPMTGGLMTYDAENRMLTATKGGLSSRYSYNADGQRVRRIIGVQETWQVYGIGGELVAEYAAGPASSTPQKEYGYRGGQMLVVWDGSGIGDQQLQWLVQDHLGSTRMVVDRSGSLGGVRRRDFAPYGEELSAGVGIRSEINGYSGDSVRQKFDGYERDAETGLDFAEARYFASIQGRFTSPDPFLSSGQVDDPQSWNRYSFGLNNPLRYTDPFGLYVFDSSVTEEQRRKFNAALDQARKDLTKIGEKYGTNSDKYKKAQRALDVYGEKDKNNGVTIRTQEGAGAGRTGVEGVAGQRTADNPNGQNIRVEFDANAYDHSGFSNLIGHEGSHAADASEWVSSGFAASKNPTRYGTEVDAYTVTSLLVESRRNAIDFPNMLPGYRNRRGVAVYLPDQIYMYQSSWAEAEKDTLRRANIDRFLERPRYAGGLYGVTPNRQGRRAFQRGARF